VTPCLLFVVVYDADGSYVVWIDHQLTASNQLSPKIIEHKLCKVFEAVT